MVTPTKSKILERARELFHHREGTSINPEESELKESGYMNEVKEDLMGSKRGSEAYAQQEQYMHNMGEEMDLSVRPKSEVRTDKWKMRAYKDVIKRKGGLESQKPTLRGSHFSKVSRFYAELKEPYPSGHQAWPRGTNYHVGSKLKSGMERLAFGSPEQRQQKKVEIEMFNTAKLQGRQYGIKHETYWEGFREGRTKVANRGQNNLLSGRRLDFATGIDFINKDVNQMFSLNQTRRPTANQKKKKDDMFSLV